MERNADTHIRVSEQTWRDLNQLKGPGDSFDDVIRDLLDDEGDGDAGVDGDAAAESGESPGNKPRA